MNSPTLAPSSPVRGVLWFALFLGVAADLLLRATPWGLNLGLWLVLAVTGLLAMAYRARLAIPPAAWPGLAFAGLSGLLAAGRGSAELLALGVAAGVGSLLLAAWAAHGGRFGFTAVTDFVGNAVLHALHTALGLLAWVGEPVGFRRGADKGVASQAARVLIGAAASAPLLVLFTLLFSSADAVFAKGVKSAFDFDPATLLRHMTWIAVWTWLSAGYGRRFLTGIALPRAVRFAPRSPDQAPDVEVLTSLGLLTALFLVFVGIQVRYLFGDDALVQSTTGLTYADYARKGFFELVAAVTLVVPILLAGDWLLGNSKHRRGFQVVAGSLLITVGLVVASAWHRLHLYTAAYGLTDSRLYAAAALIWLAAISVWLLLCVLPGHRERFCAGALASAAVIFLALHIMNPDAFIARHNTARARAGAEFDVEHAKRLGPDAVPVLLANLDILPPKERADFLGHLRKKYPANEAAADWRTWNLARQRAATLVQAVRQ